jgi:alpha-tubulin suppressor-like RCC1 family protein
VATYLYWDGVSRWRIGSVLGGAVWDYHGQWPDVLPGNPWAVQDGVAPAPTVAANGSGWEVTGAGTALDNGLYLPAGTYNGHPYYTPLQVLTGDLEFDGSKTQHPHILPQGSLEFDGSAKRKLHSAVVGAIEFDGTLGSKHEVKVVGAFEFDGEVLVVQGQLDLSGDFEFDGTITSTVLLTVDLVGDTEFDGEVVVAPPHVFALSGDLEIDGELEVTYHLRGHLDLDSMATWGFKTRRGGWEIDLRAVGTMGLLPLYPIDWPLLGLPHKLWAWGYNGYGGLGDGTLVDKLSPVQLLTTRRFRYASGGLAHSMAIELGGKVWTWGAGVDGQLGNGAVDDRTQPGLVAGGHTFVYGAAGGSHCVGLDDGGLAWAWGLGTEGQLGNGADLSESTPVAVTGGIYLQVEAGADWSAALTEDGYVDTWGGNAYGQLGDGNLGVSTNLPATIGGLPNLVRLARSGTSWHAGGLTAELAPWLWGRNDHGQLGDGTTTDSDLPGTVVGNPTYVALVLGRTHTLALALDGSAWAWGANDKGQLGDGTTTERLTPVQVSGGQHFIAIAAGAASYGLTEEGEIWAWGPGVLGELGNDAGADSLVPVQATPAATWSGVAAGLDHALAWGELELEPSAGGDGPEFRLIFYHGEEQVLVIDRVIACQWTIQAVGGCDTAEATVPETLWGHVVLRDRWEVWVRGTLAWGGILQQVSYSPGLVKLAGVGYRTAFRSAGTLRAGFRWDEAAATSANIATAIVDAVAALYGLVPDIDLVSAWTPLWGYVVAADAYSAMDDLASLEGAVWGVDRERKAYYTMPGNSPVLELDWEALVDPLLEEHGEAIVNDVQVTGGETDASSTNWWPAAISSFVNQPAVEGPVVGSLVGWYHRGLQGSMVVQETEDVGVANAPWGLVADQLQIAPDPLQLLPLAAPYLELELRDVDQGDGRSWTHIRPCTSLINLAAWGTLGTNYPPLSVAGEPNYQIPVKAEEVLLLRATISNCEPDNAGAAWGPFVQWSVIAWGADGTVVDRWKSGPSMSGAGENNSDWLAVSVVYTIPDNAVAVVPCLSLAWPTVGWPESTRMLRLHTLQANRLVANPGLVYPEWRPGSTELTRFDVESTGLLLPVEAQASIATYGRQLNEASVSMGGLSAATAYVNMKLFAQAYLKYHATPWWEGNIPLPDYWNVHPHQGPIRLLNCPYDTQRYDAEETSGVLAISSATYTYNMAGFSSTFSLVSLSHLLPLSGRGWLQILPIQQETEFTTPAQPIQKRKPNFWQIAGDLALGWVLGRLTGGLLGKLGLGKIGRWLKF